MVVSMEVLELEACAASSLRQVIRHRLPTPRHVRMHRYLADAAGHVIDCGRKRRLVSDVQFDLLVIRDHGCRWRGCSIPAAGCDAHHATHWLDGAPPTLPPPVLPIAF